ncbi:MAG: O-succinylhomoserine sulfhydrylase [Gammaproteobacteria bacterium]|nr:O-succinylhomoserine sulfhydrylase [Gammaproteobacteria bacterium]
MFRFETLAVRHGQRRGPEGEHNDPIYATSSFVFDSAEQAARRFAETEPGNVYSRFTNPTVASFERRLAALEGAEHGVAAASGMGAILTTILTLLQAGDKVVMSRSLFGSTLSLFGGIFARFGIESVTVDPCDLAQWRSAIDDRTRLLFAESPTNPLGEVVDIAELAEIAHAADALLVIDNCFCTPALQQPLEFGADIVIHSATKFLDGQGRCVGGAVVTRSKALYDKLFATMRTAGVSMSPFNAWVFLKGLETLKLRMHAHSERALVLARWLRDQPQVSRVYYPGLEENPGYQLARRQQSAFGGVLSFDLVGGREQAFSVINAVRLFSITANLGDAKSTITHPASTTHGRLKPEQRADAGIGEGLIRIAVGLEDIDDLTADLQRAFAQIDGSGARADVG